MKTRSSSDGTQEMPWLQFIPTRLHEWAQESLHQAILPRREQTFHDMARGEATVQEYDVDFSDEVLGTVARLARILADKQPGCHYLNPQFTVSASAPCDEFYFQAESCCSAWCGRLDRTFRIGGRKSTLKRESEPERMLHHTGVLVVNGEFVKDARPLLKDVSKIRRGKRTKNAVGHPRRGVNPSVP